MKQQQVDIAAQCFFNSLIKECASWTKTECGSGFELNLLNNKGKLMLRCDFLSSCGPHNFIFPVIHKTHQLRVELSFIEAVNLLLSDSDNFNGVDNELLSVFISRVEQSYQNTHQALEYRGQDIANLFELSSTFIGAEQSLFTGHSMHPAPKSREHFSAKDFSYAPESGESFAVHWWLVDEACFAGEFFQSDTAVVIGQILEDLGSPVKDIPLGYRAFPVHPWQAKVLLLRDDIQNLMQQQRIKDSGVTSPGWRATTSLRAIYHPSCRFMLKFSLSVKLTNSIRHLSMKEVKRGVLLESILASESGQELLQQNPDFKVAGEPGYATLLDGGSAPIEESIVSFRHNPFLQDNKQSSLVLATMTQCHPNKYDNLISYQVRNYAQVNSLNESSAAQHWFECFLDKVLKPLVMARSNYGLIFLAHQQNILVEIEHHLPVGMVYRDCQGTGFTCAAREKFAELLGGEAPENFMPHQYVDPFVSYYLIINSTFSVISALASRLDIDEQVLLSQLQLFILGLKQRDLVDSGFVDYLLTSEQLIFKGNFFVYLQNTNENTIEDPSTIYRQIDNPIRYKGEALPQIRRLPNNKHLAFTLAGNSELAVQTAQSTVQFALNTCGKLIELDFISATPELLTHTDLLAIAEFCCSQDSEISAVTLSSNTWSQVCYESAADWMKTTDGMVMISYQQLKQCPELYLSASTTTSVETMSVSNGVLHPIRMLHPQGTFYRRFSYQLGKEISFRLADPDTDLTIFHQWMNDSRVSYFWELAQPKAELKKYLENGLNQSHQFPVIASIDDVPFGYFELYWAKEDRLGPYYDAGNYDRGMHLLIGNSDYLGSKYWQVWGDCLAQYCFLAEPRTRLLVGEPRVDNQAIVKLWQFFGFDKVKEFDFPHKRAALVALNRDKFFNLAVTQKDMNDATN